MLAKVHSCALIGLDGAIVEVEADLNTRALPAVTLVGLPDAAVKESTDRVRAAIINSGLSYPRGRVTVNLAPADLRKEGPAYDLPIAVALLVLAEQIPAGLDGMLFLGELSLDGTLRHINGVLPMAHLAKERGFKALFVPQVDAPEAALVEGIDVYPVDTLGRLAAHFRDYHPIETYRSSFDLDANPPSYACDFQDIKGQEHVKRALEVAAAGGHNCLLSGPPGAGKTLLARSMPSILPRLTLDEALDVTRWGRAMAATGRDQPGTPRGAVPRRDARVLAAYIGSIAPATRGQDGYHQPGAGQPRLPGEFHAGRRAESMSVWLLRRPGARVQL